MALILLSADDARKVAANKPWRAIVFRGAAFATIARPPRQDAGIVVQACVEPDESFGNNGQLAKRSAQFVGDKRTKCLGVAFADIAERA